MSLSRSIGLLAAAGKDVDLSEMSLLDNMVSVLLGGLRVSVVDWRTTGSGEEREERGEVWILSVFQYPYCILLCVHY